MVVCFCCKVCDLYDVVKIDENEAEHQSGAKVVLMVSFHAAVAVTTHWCWLDWPMERLHCTLCLRFCRYLFPLTAV